MQPRFVFPRGMVPAPSRGGLAAALSLAASLLLLAPRAEAAALRHCPCSRGSALVQAQEDNPCGCGAGPRLTPRSDLKQMSIGQLEEHKGQLSSEISQLNGQFQAQVAEQEDMLGGMRERLKAVGDAGAQKKGVAAENRAAKKEEQAKIGAAIDKDEADAQTLAKAVGQERLKLTQMSYDLSSGLAAAASRCTTCQEVMFVERRLHLAEYGPLVRGAAGPRLGLLSRSKQEEGDIDPHVALEREVEALEERRAAVRQELEQGVMGFSAAQRALLDEMDNLKRKMGRQDISDSQAGARLVEKAKRLERQAGAVARFKAAQEQNLERAKKDAADVKAKLDELRAAMEKCGCAK